ncbi:MAG: hypothetical protein A3C93_00620 [Candidatus Lloydbacteria bacterium RIFCSPHIGHO2_02_FULL_54_17]|uniref:Bifunctional protein FolD n=1 Tax=Candidatus Lloydbacteria bacterium RIFCSPHIGHO2_02_FULL_54_17 TaxID=1798664 RepID=A0A1G2DES7_9BACT|nr:MAG: hypothetical protein A2762_03535 [Candidatus Lloydbacteria bacterium RIFCSPHIGHO2_01_FULL_54_11]OGZ12145.1 MAG: hypothetical protein A3C93_00620 [Candidatus Lloydbacteria bacterium RIFCSPHIGHO2_02_FULL_54_17]OGZ12935.1 MAG: hypothetical protein A2948_01060 [Candidatus Lloydbacteria bacterium RIFCSPLOWO2_01_FULL_54_18]OGZ15935.1 MAG: hypothetical protein A3H76_02425 [Candidatus Lloydbacteria bacterium RIFCSPLOWO2_02_FULL_54_12]
MIIDGKMIAEGIREKVARAVRGFAVPPTLAIVVVGENPVIESFVRIKKKTGEALGIPVVEYHFPVSANADALVRTVARLGADRGVAGIIVQLPLPPSIDARKILDAVPLEKDVDVLSTNAVAAFRRGDALVLPPIAGAMQEILEHNMVAVSGKEALVLGHGRLVGVPAALFLRHNGAHVTVVDKPIPDLAEHVRESDIIVSGVGKPGLLRPEWLKHGAVVIDAGTSEAEGKLVGDADPECAKVAGLFTPVPGGVGPITVALIFKNLLVLAKKTGQDGTYKVES